MLPEGGESPPEFFARLLPARGAAAIERPFDGAPLDQMARYLARVDRIRRSTNLTGPFPAEELVSHAVESMLGAGDLPPGARVADIGSGAGFPGVPLAIVRPDVTLVPIEPRRKRRDFLDGCSAEIGIGNLQPSVASLAALPPGSVGAATARAVGDLASILGDHAAALAPDAVLVVWTTEPEVLARQLAGSFVLEESRAVAGTDRKRIARFRRRAVRGDKARHREG
jgi:16S rRNA (guanine527-N7)-methyltransferase